MRTRDEIERMLLRVNDVVREHDRKGRGSGDAAETAEIIYDTLQWVMGHIMDQAILDYIDTV